MKKRVKSRVINKVISGVSVFMFTVGFATHAYLEAKNIELTKTNTAYAMTTDANTVIEHAKEYLGWDNATFQNNGKNICQSHWCASYISLCYSETGTYNPVPEGADIRVEEFAYWFSQHNRLHINPNANISGFTTMYTGNSLSEYVLSQNIDYGSPEFGDILLVDWDHDGMPDHVCFYLEHTGNTLITLDGNHPEHEDDDWYDTHVAEVYYDYYDYFNENYLYGWISPFYSFETEEERIEREAREAREREEAEIQSIADFTANMTENTFEAMYDILDDNKLTITFEPGDEGSVEQPTATIFRNACPIHSFPDAIANEGYTFVSWVDENGETKDNNSIYENDTTLYGQYLDSNGNIIINTPTKQIGIVTWEKDFTAPIYNKKRVIEDDTTENISESVTTQSDIFLGDVNNDGYINAVDSSIILQYTAQIATSGISLSPEELLRADIDRDGRISSNDSRLALSYYTYLAVLDGSEKMTFDEYLANN